jgi:hypothetical protein
VFEQAFFEAGRASLGNPEALAALFQISCEVEEHFDSLSKLDLDQQLNEWGRMLIGVGAPEVDRLKRQLKAAILSGGWSTMT